MIRNLENLLCIIHRDGGQYIIEHGIEKAFDDAVEIHYKQREAFEHFDNSDYAKCRSEIRQKLSLSQEQYVEIEKILLKHFA